MFQSSHDLSGITWLPLVSVIIFIIIFSMGYGPIPWIIVGEIFPSNVKGIASSATAACNWMLAFYVTKIFQNMIDLVGLPASYGVFAMICVIGTAFVFTLVPETNGKSIDEVQAILYGGTSPDSGTRTLRLDTKKFTTSSLEVECDL